MLLTPDEASDVLLELPSQQHHQDGGVVATPDKPSQPEAVCGPSGVCEGCYFNSKCFDLRNYPKANRHACEAKGGHWCKDQAAASPRKKTPTSQTATKRDISHM